MCRELIERANNEDAVDGFDKVPRTQLNLKLDMTRSIYEEWPQNRLVVNSCEPEIIDAGVFKVYGERSVVPDRDKMTHTHAMKQGHRSLQRLSIVT